MKRLLISVIALAGLGGCATYHDVDGHAPGGYYSGSPSYQYTYPDGYYGAYGGNYGDGLWGGYGGGYFGGYGYSPGYYGGYRRPIYVIRQQPRPPRGDHDHNGNGHHRPPPVVGGGAGGNRPRPEGARPWRPGEGRPRQSSLDDGNRPHLNRPGRPRPEASRPVQVRPPGQVRPRSQSRPASPAVPRGSHFRNRPARDGR